MEYYSAIKKNEILLFAATRMDLEGIMLSEISQTEKDKYCLISFICGIWKIKQISEYNKRRSRLTDTENKLVVASGVGAYRGGEVGGTNYWV